MAAEFDVALDLWLLVHRDLRPVARIDTVFGFLADAIRRDKEHFATFSRGGHQPSLKARLKLSSKGFIR